MPVTRFALDRDSEIVRDYRLRDSTSIGSSDSVESNTDVSTVRIFSRGGENLPLVNLAAMAIASQ